MNQCYKNFRVLFIFCCSLFSDLHTNAQIWEAVGGHGFSAGEAEFISIAVDTEGTPYVVFQDYGNFKKATVMKYNGARGMGWVNVGNPGFSTGAAYYTSIVIDRHGTPYVVYMDAFYEDRAVVKKYDGTTWVDVGMPGFSAGEANYPAITIDSSGTPYIAYEDFGNNKKATVMKYTGAEWALVGDAGFSDSTVNYTGIAIDRQGTPYVVYVDFSRTNQAIVMKYNGVGWELGGNYSNVDNTHNSYSTIAIDKNGTIYVAYRDQERFVDGSTVMNCKAGYWDLVGYQCFSGGEAIYTSIAIDNDGTPYIAYAVDAGGYFAASVMSYDSINKWTFLGGNSFVSADPALYTSIAIDKNNMLYLAYQDGATSNDGVTVMKYQSPDKVNSIVKHVDRLAVTPNPVGHGSTCVLNISATQNEVANIVISDMMGQKVKEINTNTNTDIQIQLNCPPGVYFISAVTAQGKLSGKVVVW